jgi:hypothetical protein
MNEMVTVKLSGESEQQYTAFLLYCEVGSLRKLFDTWDKLGQASGEMRVDFMDKLGGRPSHATIERWSKKYQWVKRADARLSEEMQDLDYKLRKIKQRRVYLISEIFWEKLKRVQKQMKSGELSTVQEVKTLWEMMRIEFGETTSKHEFINGINEAEQKSPTPEEQELGKTIDQAIKDFYNKKIKEKYEVKKDD